jgi:spore coat polysaccharide biosynthesis predicted glycosyltransferase SpsG
MKILFRADANNSIGFGHLIRTLSIIHALKNSKRHSDIQILVSGNISEQAKDILKENKITFSFKLYDNEVADLLEELSQYTPEILFIDKLYNYSEKDIKQLNSIQRTIIMHNLCDGAPFSDTFILPSAHTSYEKISAIKWDEGIAQKLIGPEYIILNKDILNHKKIDIESFPLTLSVITGGTDPVGVMPKLLEMMLPMNLENLNINFLYGKGVTYLDKIRKLIKTAPTNYNLYPFSPHRMSLSDIAICTFGITTYELFYLGIPVISVAHAPLNAEGSLTLRKRFDSHIDLGLIDRLNAPELHNSIINLYSEKKLREKYSQKGKELVDGKGAKRISDIILK